MALINLLGLRQIAHAAGAAGTHVYNTAVHGTRPPIDRGADVAHPHRPAIGRMIHSVYEGPKRRFGHKGAPVVKRPRSA